MADINEILQRTKSRSEKVKITRLPPSIATTDRPYHVDNPSKLQLSIATTVNQNTESVGSRKTEDNSRTNRGQFEDKPRTNRGQLEDKPKSKTTIRGQTEDGNEDKIEDNSRTNRGQTENETADFFSLSGLQKNITIYLYNVCKVSRDKMTKPISLELIANSCKTTPVSAKKTLQRLEKKGIITRNSFKSGRGGWTSYCLPNNVFQKILYMETEDNSRTIRGQFEDKPRAEPRTEPRTTPLSSSGNYSNLNNTTTTSDKVLSPEWLQIDIEPLANIGFTQTHLTQIASQNFLQPDVVQNSIYAFAFDLETNKKTQNIKGLPLNFFMGILRKGQPYAPPDNYEHPKDKAIRIYAENMRKVVQKREEVRKEAMNVAFEDWYHNLPNEEAKNLLPDEIKLPPSFAAAPKESRKVRDKAREHFIENIWSTLQTTIEESEPPKEEI